MVAIHHSHMKAVFCCLLQERLPQTTLLNEARTPYVQYFAVTSLERAKDMYVTAPSTAIYMINQVRCQHSRQERLSGCCSPVYTRLRHAHVRGVLFSRQHGFVHEGCKFMKRNIVAAKGFFNKSKDSNAEHSREQWQRAQSRIPSAFDEYLSAD
jgi:hypothetical protein